MTAVTKGHKPHDVQSQEFVLSQPGGQKSEIKAHGVDQAAPPEALGEEPSRGLLQPWPLHRAFS